MPITPGPSHAPLRLALTAALVLLCVALTGARKRSRDGTLQVQSTTIGATIVVDGEAIGEVPMDAPLTLKPGSHTIKVQKPGHADYIDTFKIAARKATVLEIDLLPVAGVLRFESTPTGAAVIVDGRQLGETPYQGELPPGKRVVELRLTGYTVYRREFAVRAGETYPLAADLVPLPVIPDDELVTPWYGHWWVWAGAAAVVGGITAAVLLSDDGRDAPPNPPFLLDIDPIR
ncbi:MAG: PEGA domain-containing protein [Myxococcales bacterium]|nr:PEGA domain-containing protein [Myxococcales bacterium]